MNNQNMENKVDYKHKTIENYFLVEKKKIFKNK